jgi:hypothetical protein
LPPEGGASSVFLSPVLSMLRVTPLTAPAQNQRSCITRKYNKTKMEDIVMKNKFKLLVIGIVSLIIPFNACDEFGNDKNFYWEYEFVNQTQYSIQISVNKGYKLSNEKDSNSPEYNSDIYLYYNSNKIIYIKSDAVDFQWTASYNSGNNKYIYAVTNGSTVIFKERRVL